MINLWLKQDLKDLVRIVEYLKKLALEIEGLKEFFEECVNRNNVGKLIIVEMILRLIKKLKTVFYIIHRIGLQNISEKLYEENINFKDKIFLFPYFFSQIKILYIFCTCRKSIQSGET